MNHRATKPANHAINTPQELAKPMANLAQLIRDAIKTVLNDDHQGGILRDKLQALQKLLIRDLTVAEFADMYAQTICYGLFVARCNMDNINPFSRETAHFYLAKNEPFLRLIFAEITNPHFEQIIIDLIDKLIDILQQTDIKSILAEFGKRTRKEDPVVHFYETFLAEYDPKMRESRGVYYTPEPVVSYLVKSVDYILKNKFNISQGLADAKKIIIPNPKGEGTIETHQVLILDPAVGTGTFMYGIIKHIYANFKGQKGMWSSYVSQHLLPRLFGFELLMAPYTVAHIKLCLQLQELGYDFKADERLRIYLTNTLQEAFQIPAADGFMNRIRDEAEAAKDVKQDVPVMVIIGNPPYSAVSQNTDPWIVGLVRDYYQIDGKSLGERNPKLLLDDYVKFIRFAQHRVSETGYGILAFVTNHGYLDNPTFRGMRQNLMKTFDEIYVLDLHGNSKKKEVSPDGAPDKNVFDIQQGVSIGIFIKYQHSQQKLASVYHADLWGIREIYEQGKLVGGKYHWLGENDISSTDWKILNPQGEFYLFKPQNNELLPEYEQGWKITEIMLVNSTGVKSHRDHFVFDFDLPALKNRIESFRNLSIQDSEIGKKYDLRDTPDWQISRKRKSLAYNNEWQNFFTKCLYRPFDIRDYYHNQELVDRPKHEVMQHIINGQNLGLITVRQVAEENFNHVLVTTNIIECRVTMSNKGAGYLFPLYLYPTDTPTLFDAPPTNAPGGRRPNLAPEFITEFAEKLDLEFIPEGKGDKMKTFAPEDIFNYIYAIFHGPNYRQRYAEFLKIDFPRVPLTGNKALFWELAEIGDKLVKLHLMKETGGAVSNYPIPGSDLVEQVKYNEKNQQIWINADQYFDQIPPAIWNFYIGGYQVCQKWLKDRKNRVLNFDDLTHYQNIISILGETINIMANIDQILDKYGGFPIV